ncbi:MAG: HlyD family secretion protein [Spirochaetia bacterium]
MSDMIATTEEKGTTAVARQDKGGNGASGKPDEGRKSRKGPVLFGSVILIIIAGVGLVLGGRWLVDTINYVSTDDAAIDGNHVNVSAKTLGRISKMLAEEGDKVASGQVLVLLDDTDLRAQEALASASLAYAKRNVELSKINLDRAQSDSDRARTLLGSGAMTKEQAEHTTNALQAASAQYTIALAQVDTASAQVGVLEDQFLNTRISSPMAGVVAKKYMMQGDVVQPGQTIYTINDLDRVWVTANFEETKTGRIELGAPVEVTVDAFKGTLTGKVALIGAGIVAPPFSIGDFTKTTQRVPVRITLDNGQSFIPGLSAEVKVRTKALFKLPFGLEGVRWLRP